MSGQSQGRLARVAARQHGVVARRQLEFLGLSRDQIDGELARGRLHVVHRGVYAVGHARITQRGRWMAAVLACGPGAVLSHRDAAALWDLRPVPSGPIHVTVEAAGRRQRTAIRLHTTRTLHPAERRVLDGIPVTSVSRLLLDLAETVHRQQLRLAFDAAERLDLLDQRSLDDVVARHHGRRGLKALHRELAEHRRRHGETPWTRSERENRMLALIREARLPEPSCNVSVAGFVVDFHWPLERIVVEVDSWRAHKSWAKFEDDRLRDAKLTLDGQVVVRATRERIEFGSPELADDLGQLLAARRPRWDAA